jgi:hypothetical protein
MADIVDASFNRLSVIVSASHQESSNDAQRRLGGKRPQRLCQPCDIRPLRVMRQAPHLS